MQAQVSDIDRMDGQTLRYLRESAGMTQTDLAAKLEVAPATISNAEANKRNVSVPLALSWIKACNATMIAVPFLEDTERALIVDLANLVPKLDPLRLSDLKVLVAHWRQENVKTK